MPLYPPGLLYHIFRVNGKYYVKGEHQESFGAFVLHDSMGALRCVVGGGRDGGLGL